MQQLLVQALRAYAQIRDACQSLLEASRSSDAAYGSYAARQLQFYSERCQSLNLLLQHGKLWDCDILSRPALECATRFIFVSIAEPEERTRRIREYSVDLNELEELQLSEKAKASAASMPRSDNKTIVDFIVVSPEREADLRARWPKQADCFETEVVLHGDGARYRSLPTRSTRPSRLPGALAHLRHKQPPDSCRSDCRGCDF
jgi:hypothetical protein